MNRKEYWKLRKLFKTIVFKIKTCIYRLIDFVSEKSEYLSFKRLIIKSLLSGIIKDSIFIIIGLWLDTLVLKNEDVPAVDKFLLIPVIIGGIGVAGVILGLYCANIASIYSSKYSNAPNEISDEVSEIVSNEWSRIRKDIEDKNKT